MGTISTKNNDFVPYKRHYCPCQVNKSKKLTFLPLINSVYLHFYVRKNVHYIGKYPIMYKISYKTHSFVALSHVVFYKFLV
jgi:hypothetical protein